MKKSAIAISAIILAAAGSVMSAAPVCAAPVCAAAPSGETAAETGVMHNPMLWADVPDPDVIRVGDDFYMVSTTMHLMPGCPVMHSKDLVNWETISYVFDRIEDTPRYDLEEGTVYGRGQ